jgi:predicted protein tyrosine phosphatase
MRGTRKLADLVIEGARLDIAVVSREIAARYSCDVRHAVLSITDPGMGPARLADNPNRLGLLRLSFDDVDPGLGYRGSAYSAFNEGLARTAADFVAAQVATSELLVVQCEFGRSRSAGLGAAFSRWANGDDAEFFVRFEPNRHVYEVMLRQLESYPFDRALA